MAHPTGLDQRHSIRKTERRHAEAPLRNRKPPLSRNCSRPSKAARSPPLRRSNSCDELRARGQPCSGRKDDLVERLIRDNVSRRATASMDASTLIQAADDDDRQAHLEMLSVDNARLRAELDILTAELSRTSASYSREAPHDSSPRVRRLGEQVTSSDLITDRTFPLTQRGRRGPPAASPIQIHSTSDTSSSIPIFDGSPQESAHRWIAQVERIAALAHWTSSLTLASAASRLAGSARDWHSAYGWRYETWEEWRDALTQRFRRRLTMQEFIELQSKRRLQNNETIVEYMYSKNAVLDKVPYRDFTFEVTTITGENTAEISRLPHAPGKINKKVVNVEQLRRYKERQLDMAELSPWDDTCA
ncbi:hypothetical protein HPB50_003699 [Hyalomma asiaticum]|uniref:Uncharacterized protein n=1 Tax=Hyalomma asiaticum TaxID=266040 RepID=A0ACB7SC71_HYAAI|nr:hypothetical protein HPB50_003699 [Hyalomma asiaticum]